MDERSETATERDDRKWEDILQELRVVQTSAQLTAGFLLTLPFQQRFAELSDAQETFYLVLVVVACLVTALVLTPIAIHRELVGRHIKGRVVSAGHVLVRMALLSLALLIVGITTFVFDVLLDRGAAAVVGTCLGGVLVGLLVVLPRMLVSRRQP